MLGTWELYESNGPAHHPGPLENRHSRQTPESLNGEIMFVAIPVTQVVPVIARSGINPEIWGIRACIHVYKGGRARPGTSYYITKMLTACASQKALLTLGGPE